MPHSEIFNDICIVACVGNRQEMVDDFGRSESPLQPVKIDGVDTEVVQSYKYVGVHLDNKLDWSVSNDVFSKNGQRQLFFLCRLRSFNMWNEILYLFYHTVECHFLCYCLQGPTTLLIKTAGSCFLFFCFFYPKWSSSALKCLYLAGKKEKKKMNLVSKSKRHTVGQDVWGNRCKSSWALLNSQTPWTVCLQALRNSWRWEKEEQKDSCERTFSAQF